MLVLLLLLLVVVVVVVVFACFGVWGIAASSVSSESSVDRVCTEEEKEEQSNSEKFQQQSRVFGAGISAANIVELLLKIRVFDRIVDGKLMGGMQRIDLQRL